jgi:putative peptidoglycan lipid II flippase
MLLMVLPILLLSGLVILANSLLLVNGHYIFPSLAQLIVPIFAVIFLVTFADQYGVNAVIMGMMLGQIANFILVNRLLSKEDVQLFPLEFKSSISDKKHFWGGYAHLVVIAVFTSVAILVNTLLASSLGGGAVSIYNLGSKVSLFFTGIITSVFSSLLLPYFSRLAAHSNHDLLNQETSFLIILGSMLSVPFSLIFFLNAEFISAFIFTKLSSENASILGIASVMKYSIIQLPFWVTNSIFLRHANSINKTQLIALIAIVAFIINLFLGLYLIEFMNVGGLALASTISVAISSGLILLNYFYKKVINLFNATLIIVAWISFAVVVIATKFNWFFVQIFAIILLMSILFFKLKRIAYLNNSKVSN